MCKLQPTAYSLQHAAYSMQPTACSLQHAAYSLQPTAYSLQHTAGGVVLLCPPHPPDIHPQRTKSTPLCVVHPARPTRLVFMNKRALARDSKTVNFHQTRNQAAHPNQTILQVYKPTISSYPYQGSRTCATWISKVKKLFIAGPQIDVRAATTARQLYIQFIAPQLSPHRTATA